MMPCILTPCRLLSWSCKNWPGEASPRRGDLRRWLENGLLSSSASPMAPALVSLRMSGTGSFSWLKMLSVGALKRCLWQARVPFFSLSRSICLLLAGNPLLRIFSTVSRLPLAPLDPVWIVRISASVRASVNRLRFGTPRRLHAGLPLGLASSIAYITDNGKAFRATPLQGYLTQRILHGASRRHFEQTRFLDQHPSRHSGLHTLDCQSLELGLFASFGICILNVSSFLSRHPPFWKTNESRRFIMNLILTS